MAPKTSFAAVEDTKLLKPSDLAQYIDHTCLKADATPTNIEKICAEAKSNHFKAVCVNPGFIPLVSESLAGSNVLICSVVGFPLGATTTDAKVFEACGAVEAGALEIDTVISIGQLKAGNYKTVQRDIEQVVIKAKPAIVKVIIECSLLTDQEKILACKISKDAGAAFVKTSTGFFGGATVKDVALLRKTVGNEVGVKASGGIKNFQDALSMITAGANRIGASAGIKIINNQ